MTSREKLQESLITIMQVKHMFIEHVLNKYGKDGLHAWLIKANKKYKQNNQLKKDARALLQDWETLDVTKSQDAMRIADVVLGLGISSNVIKSCCDANDLKSQVYMELLSRAKNTIFKTLHNFIAQESLRYMPPRNTVDSELQADMIQHGFVGAGVAIEKFYCHRNQENEIVPLFIHYLKIWIRKETCKHLSTYTETTSMSLQGSKIQIFKKLQNLVEDKDNIDVNEIVKHLKKALPQYPLSTIKNAVEVYISSRYGADIEEIHNLGTQEEAPDVLYNKKQIMRLLTEAFQEAIPHKVEKLRRFFEKHLTLGELRLTDTEKALLREKLQNKLGPEANNFLFGMA